jgi:chemotaxis protein CheX
LRLDRFVPFQEAVVKVLGMMALVEARPGRAGPKLQAQIKGEVTGVIGLAGSAKGTLSLTFSLPVIQEIMRNLLGEEVTAVTHEVKDAVGELTNMISGDGRRALAEQGLALSGSVPVVIAGPEVTVSRKQDAQTLAVPFDTAAGRFWLEVCIIE